MSDEPERADDDGALNLRLAELCEFPVQEGWAEFYPDTYPQLRCDVDGTLLFVETDRGGDDPWNPLGDERQCFRHVVAALRARGLSWNLVDEVDRSQVGVHVYRFRTRQSPMDYDIYVTEWARDRKELTRIICLAALEAWEKLEKIHES